MINTTVFYNCDKVICFSLNITSIFIGICVGLIIYEIAYLIKTKRTLKEKLK